MYEFSKKIYTYYEIITFNIEYWKDKENQIFRKSLNNMHQINDT